MLVAEILAEASGRGDLGGVMRTLVLAGAIVILAAGLSSCFLVSIPVKATGELIEKSADATGEAINRGIHRVTRPSNSTGNSEGEWDAWEEDSGEGHVEGDLEHLPPLLPQR